LTLPLTEFDLKLKDVSKDDSDNEIINHLLYFHEMIAPKTAEKKLTTTVEMKIEYDLKNAEIHQIYSRIIKKIHMWFDESRRKIKTAT
jgi:CRISPR/Cas system CSM-associated protein Csm2 small subunit